MSKNSLTGGFRPEPYNPKHWSFELKLQPKLKADWADLSTFSSPRHHQLSTSSCVAQATVKALEILRNKKYGMENHIDLSILMVYYLAREMMLPKETHWDNGTYISHAFEVLRRFGVCAEILWPFDPKKVTESPSWDAMRSAYSHKIHNYYQITATHKDRIDSVITAIQSGHPVVFGTAIGLNWFGYKKDQVLKPVANADIRGRHATVIVDWDEERELFKGENSWGLHWGDNGFYWMSPSYVAWSQSSDFWVPTMPWED